MVIIASNYGQERNPAWYHNLRADPQATIEFEGDDARDERRASSRARSASASTRAGSRSTRAGPQYRTRAAHRRIPVMELTPARRPASAPPVRYGTLTVARPRHRPRPLQHRRALRSASSDAMKLIEPTRASSPSASSSWALAKTRSSSGPNRRLCARRPPARRRCGAPGRRRGSGATSVLDRAVDRVVLDAPIPEQREQAAGRQHASDLRQRGVAVEPVEGLATVTASTARVAERDRLRGAVAASARLRRQRRAHLARRAPPRSPRRPAASSGRVSLPVPAARSSTAAPAATQRPRSYTDRLRRIPGPAPLVGVRRAREPDRGGPVHAGSRKLSPAPAARRARPAGRSVER